MGELTGKIALVTGVEDVGGQEIALHLARECAAVGIIYSADPTYANAVLAQIDLVGGRAISIRADLSNAAAISRLLDEIIARFGNLDLVVNHAPAAAHWVAPEATPEEFERSMGATCRGMWLISQEASRRLASGGRIINLTTMRVNGDNKAPEGATGG